MSVQFPFGKPSGGEPIPVVSLTLIDRAGRTTPTLTAILDTGADGTLVPLSILRAAGFKPSRVRREFVPSGVGRSVETVIGYEVTAQIGGLVLPGLDIFGSAQLGDTILGRNVLNQLVFTYDGPRRLLDILEP